MTPRRVASASFRFLFAFLSPTRERSRGARGHFPLRASCLHGIRGPHSKGAAVSRGAQADARHIDSVSVLVRPLRNSWRMFEEVPARALFPRAGVAGPTRRGPHAGPRRPLFSASTASQAQRILPTAGQAGGGKAGYKTATNEVCRGRSGRAHARGISESEPHGGLRTGSKQGRVGAPVLTCLSANRAERRFASGRGSVSKEGRDVTRAPVLRSISRTPQASVSLSCLSEGRRGSAGVRVSVRQHKLGRGEGGGMHVMSVRGLLMTPIRLSADGHYALLRCPSAPGFSNVNHPSICSPRHRSCAALAEGFERAQRVGLQGDRSREEPRAPRMRRGLQNIIKSITAPAGLVASRRGSAGARVSVGQHKLVRARGNCEVSEVAGVSDQGQISKLMISRLEDHGLVQNTKAFINSRPLGVLSHNNRGAFLRSPSISLPSTESFLTRGGLS
jgi:hypothetical protein